RHPRTPASAAARAGRNLSRQDLGQWPGSPGGGPTFPADRGAMVAGGAHPRLNPTVHCRTDNLPVCGHVAGDLFGHACHHDAAICTPGHVRLPVLELLSGGATPLESNPEALQKGMQFSPTTHFVTFAPGILFRRADLQLVWPEFAWVAGIGAALFLAALMRFRKTLIEAQS